MEDSPIPEGVAYTDNRYGRDESEVDFGYFAKLSTARDFSDFKQRISHETHRLGFSDFAFARLSGSDVDPNILATTPKELVRLYFEEGLDRHDLIVPYVQSNGQPTYRSSLEEYVEHAPFITDMSRVAQAIYDMNKSYGYYDYFHIPMNACNGIGKVMFSVTNKGDTPVEIRNAVAGRQSSLQLLCEAIDYVVTRRFTELVVGKGKKPATTIKINKKPLLMLETLAKNDLNISQVADKLFISVVTANKHLETARKALGVRTTYAAIRKAVQYGLIDGYDDID